MITSEKRFMFPGSASGKAVKKHPFAENCTAIPDAISCVSSTNEKWKMITQNWSHPALYKKSPSCFTAHLSAWSSNLRLQISWDKYFQICMPGK